MTAIPKTKMTLEEYFEFDKNAEGNFEYFNGEIFEMSGVSVNHGRIERNLTVKLSPRAFEKGCEIFPANNRIRVPTVPLYRYADLSLVCGKLVYEQVGGLECLVNPVLIIEVLSDSTEKFDKGEKFRQYKLIESFREYLLVEQHSKNVTLYLKHNDRFWLQSDYTAGETFHLDTLDLDVEVDELYQGVEFPQPLTNE
jgi:Uma2 family endonuclease